VSRPSVAVLGGAVGGLAAAERFRAFADVDLFERESYDDKRVNCGEAVNDVTLVPLAKTADNGFVNRIDGFDIEVYRATDRDPEEPSLTTARLGVENGYITDRGVLERRWAERLADAGVAVHEETNLTREDYHDVVAGYDYVVDATGQPALSLRAADRTEEYTGDLVALNADVAGDFSAFRRVPRVMFESYVGYWWAFPKGNDRANVGIGWAGEDRPDDYVAELWAACDRAGVPRPDRSAVNFYTIPQGPSLDPRDVVPEPGVFLVGDAAGIANRYQGEGICQAIRSANLLARLVETGREDEYPRRLYRLMRSEYRLAGLMRGIWEETGRTDVVAAVVDAVDGLTVEEVTRRPHRVFARLARRPGLVATLATDAGMVRRVYDAYTDRWEYGETAV
jgi:digeranylgeranylglycerophospholipid reductase